MPDYGCNLDEAFQTKEMEPPAKQKIKKKKSSTPPMPPEEYINFAQLGGEKLPSQTIIGSKDPDREQYVRPKLIEAMNNKPAWFGSTDAVEPSDFIKAMEHYADYNLANDSDVGADFMSAFRERGVQKASAVPATPIADVWKPLTPTGADTAFFNYLPKIQSQSEGVPMDYSAIQRRIASIYERLDMLETSKRDNANKEVMLFVISGVFFLFSLDLITRISK